MSTQQELLRRLRRRRLSGGAVLVEGVIVIAMLLIMMASALFFHRLYAMKLETMRASRAAAWGKALPGCNSAVELVALWQAVGVANAASGDAFDGLNEDSNDVPKWMEVGRQADVKSATVNMDQVIGGKSFELKTVNSVVCNEKGDDTRGDIIGVLQYMWDAIIPGG
jgi:threonine dehydrogenase-like Zn-dependent dehydrogenase